MKEFLNRIRRRLQPITGRIEYTWSNDYTVGMRGWLVHKHAPLKSAEVIVGGVKVPITDWHPRPDVATKLQYEHADNSGFWVQVPRMSEHGITIRATDGRRDGVLQFQMHGQVPEVPSDGEGAGELFERFIDIVNQDHLHVLEIGSRIVVPGSDSKRSLFSEAGSYTGFDYYPDDNTDVVGDAHHLADYFPDKKFDAVFSYSVLEHLAMPWLAAREVNKVLKVGGYTYHHTHFAWPLHERPWDFWRFTDEGLKILFSVPLGFEVIGAGMFEPLRMHFDRPVPGQAQFPSFPAYGGAAVLARKTHDVDETRFRWDMRLDEIDPDSQYPKRGGQ